MSLTRSTFAIVNPAAGRGRAGARIDAYLSLLKQHLPGFEHAVSDHAGHEAELADRALSDGYDSIVAVGGDGTWSNVADRIVRDGRADVALGLLPAGTGNDFGKPLGIRFENRHAVIRGIAENRRRRIDVGRVGERHFLNVVGFGFDIAVIDDAATVRLIKGDLLYRCCALRQLFRFQGLSIGVAAAGEPALPRRRHLMLVIANGNCFGGSFRIAPDAHLEDGRLDAVSIFDASPIGRARLFSRVAKGRHGVDPKVRITQAKRFVVSLDAPVRYEMDGEVYQCPEASLEVACVPKALCVHVPL